MNRIAGHMAAMVVGFVVAAVLDSGPSERNETQRRIDPVALEFRYDEDADASFTKAWRLLAGRNLDSNQRRVAQRELLGRWAREHPLHLLRFFENRAVPDGWAAVIMSELKNDRPELLLRFARDHGGVSMLWDLARDLDPRRALELFAAEPGLPPGLFNRIASRGVAADPGFAARLAEVPEGPARDAFRAGVVESQLEAGQWRAAMESLSRLEELGPAMAREFGEALAHDVAWDERAAFILSLSASLRDEAYEGAMDWCAGEIERKTTDATMIREFLEQMAEAGMNAAVPGAIELPAADAAAWGQWALELPEGGTWEILRRSGLELWLENDESAAVALLQLPPGVVRDTAMAALVRDRQGEDDEQGAAAQALGLMSPEARARLEHELAEEANGPFAE